MHKFWSFFIKNRQFSYIVLIGLIFFGVYSLISIPKESSPEVVVPVAIVNTVFPGASALNVESLITNKIEDQLSNGLDNVKKITSTSRDSVSSIVVEFEADADLDKSIQEVKDEVDLVKSELPNDAEDPAVSEVSFVDQPVLTISIASDLSQPELITLVDRLEDELKTVKGVSKISKAGIPERQVQVIVNREALQQFEVSLVDVVNALRGANSGLPAGSIEVDGINYAVSFEGDIKDASEINDISIINSNGEPVYVRDVAFVSDGVSDSKTFARVSIDGEPSEPAVSLNVFKRSGGDVTKLSDDVRDKLKDLEGGLLKDVPYLISFDNGEFVKDDLSNLSLTALQTVLLVMIILFIALGWREALIASLAIPLSFLVSFIGLLYSGNTINFISLFSLILAVGILVDSAIVVTEDIHSKLKEPELLNHPDRRKSKMIAALRTIKEFHYPLTTGTATTIAVFAPLFIVSGVSGQFISSIPFTIIFVLLASLFVALALIPLIASVILRRRSQSKLEERQEEFTHRIQNKYRSFLEGIIGNRKKEKRFIWGLILTFILVLSFPFTGLVKVIFFDQEDIDFLFIEIEKPQGTVLGQTDLSVREVEEILYQNSYIDSFIVEVGQGSQFGSGASGEKVANITLLLDKERNKTSSDILEDLRKEISGVNSAEVRVFQPNNGPPVGAPVLIKFFGDDTEKLNETVLVAESILNDIPGTSEVDTSAKNDALEFSLEVDRAKASQVGLNPSSLALTLRTALYGVEALSINDISGDTEVYVKLNLNEDYQNPSQTNQVTIDSIENIEIATAKGTVLLGSLLKTNIERASTVIDHEAGQRVATVSSELGSSGSVQKISSEFEKRIKEIGLPDGVTYTLGGETEESTTAFKEMGLSLIVGIISILAILVLQFSSYRHALYIISIVPLSLIGVFVGLALSGKALSFPSLMGFIALSGIVVNNSIILIDVMNSLRKSNPEMGIREVVIEGSVRRLRPILLTTLTTVIGIIPLTYASDLWSPLAFAIMFGLSFAVVVTLILVPILYSRKPGEVKK